MRSSRHHQVAMELDEVIVGVILPNAVGNSKMNGNEPNCNSSASLEFVRPFKQARRRQCGASIVNAAMRVRLEPEGGKWIVADAGLCFGGMAPTTVAAPRTEVRGLGARIGEAKRCNLIGFKNIWQFM